MARLFLLISVVVIVYWLLKSFSRSAAQNKPGVRDAVAEDMVRCAHCGVHLPKSESFLESGNFFCSVAHRDAYRK